MRRLPLPLVLLLLAGCGSATPSSAPTPTVSGSTRATPGSEPTIHSSPPVHLTPAVSLMPPSCTASDGLRLAGRSGEGAGSTRFAVWKLTSGTNCTLYGRPRVALLGPKGHDLHYSTVRWSWPRTAPHPVLVGPNLYATVSIAFGRCDDAGARRTSRVRMTLPGVGIVLHGRSSADYCPDVYPPWLAVAPYGTWQLDGTERPMRSSYAVNLRSSFSPGTHPTWGRADVDGDGKADTVIVSDYGRLTVDLANGRVLTTRDGLTNPARLQALTDLNGDGRPEILVAGTTIGADRGYAFGGASSTAFAVVDGRLQAAGGKEPLQFDFYEGHGDFYAGVVCGGDTVTQVSVLAESSTPLTVKRTTWRIAGAKATQLSSQTTGETGDPMTLVSSDCPGMDRYGWAS